jgi:polyhydroxyalkanoate synthesis regulator phasin
MNELIDRLVNEADLNPDQAKKAIETIANFVKERFPMLGGAVDQIFAAGNKSDE